MRLWQPVRRYQQLVQHRITHIEVEGLANVREAISSGDGVLITPNHAGHGDCYLLLEALTRLPADFYFMTAWQVFHLAGPFARLAYRHHGCFSIDREQNDLAAYREAVRLLATTSCPLVVFPEGDVYHLAEHVVPPRDGTLTMAMSAVRRTGRPVSCIPCALRYRYVEDPTAELLPVMAAIEEKVGIPRGHSLPLAQRTERLLEGTIAWRETQYLGGSQVGPVDVRLEGLREAVLTRAERTLGIAPTHGSLPERVKLIRREVVVERKECELGERPATGDAAAVRIAALEDAFVAVQLYSYLPGYVAERPTIERIAESVDKLEEDVLGKNTATVRGRRHGTVTFGPPMRIETAENREAGRRHSEELRRRMQAVVDGPHRRAQAPPTRPQPATCAS